MRVFFDTEFTGLTDDAKLISIGMVTAGGLSEFYAELSSTYGPEDCSDFCRREVLPHLSGPSKQLSVRMLRAALAGWLSERGTEVVLVCDSWRDVDQLATLMPQGLPPNVSVSVLGWWGNLRRRVLNYGRRLHQRHGLRVHHALDDAKVNRLVLGG